MIRLLFIPLLLLGLSAALPATTSAAAPAEVPSYPAYLAPDAIDYRAAIPPMPAADSFASAVDDEIAAALARARTPEQVALAKHYETLNAFLLLQPVLGEWATAENLPVTAKFMEQVRRAGRPAIEGAKSLWNRRRPYERLPGIEPAVGRPHNTSYPSGHSADSAIYVAVLTVLFPEHAAEWELQAARVRWSRLAAGVHYPSDVVAGLQLGRIIAREMLKSPQLQHDLEAVRSELRAALAAHAPKAA